MGALEDYLIDSINDELVEQAPQAVRSILASLPDRLLIDYLRAKRPDLAITVREPWEPMTEEEAKICRSEVLARQSFTIRLAKGERMARDSK